MKDRRPADRGIDSVIFDLDGTLWDASIASQMALNTSFEQCGYAVKAERKTVREISGTPLDISLKQNFTFIQKKDYATIKKLYEKNEPIFMKSRGGKLFPHGRTTLQILCTYKKLFIVSNCLKGYIENFLEQKKLGNIFTGYICSGETGLTKSENIQIIIREYRLDSPVYVGDTEWDYEASKDNNIPFVYAKYGFGKVADVQYQIKNIKELIPILQEIHPA
ncbi:MAG: HAD family hydrolase [Spirochaetales bacterium]|jgi:phosphoglycolate phosphatase|nr:HAD family hydrolase [Spirochaetales bacterium]